MTRNKNGKSNTYGFAALYEPVSATSPIAKTFGSFASLICKVFNVRMKPLPSIDSGDSDWRKLDWGVWPVQMIWYKSARATNKLSAELELYRKIRKNAWPIFQFDVEVTAIRWVTLSWQFHSWAQFQTDTQIPTPLLDDFVQLVMKFVHQIPARMS